MKSTSVNVAPRAKFPLGATASLLARGLDEHFEGNQTNLAKAMDLNVSSVNRHLRGGALPEDPAMQRQYCKLLDIPLSKLEEAIIRDQLDAYRIDLGMTVVEMYAAVRDIMQMRGVKAPVPEADMQVGAE